MKSYLRIRYIFDWIFALILLPLCIPIFLLITLVQFYVFEEVLFIQQRSGLHGKVFSLFKFKTMLDDETISEQQRIPPWGKFLRKTGIDELPQLLNILSGTMAFIGPRPLLPQYDNLYNPQQRERLLIKPGITGYAQAKDRNDTSWQQRFDHDNFYVHHASLNLDLKIIYNSIKQIMISKDQNILPPFDGNS